MPPRLSVVRSPRPPIAQTRVGFLKGASSQKTDIIETMANPR